MKCYARWFGYVLAQFTQAIFRPEEQLLMDLLFHKSDKVELKGRYNRTLRKAFKRMDKYYRQQHKGAGYRPLSFLLCGIVAMFATQILANAQSQGWTARTLTADWFAGLFFVIPLLFSSVFLLSDSDPGKPIRKRLMATVLWPLIGGGLIFLFLWAKMGFSLFQWYMPAGYFSAWCLSGYITALGFCLLRSLRNWASSALPELKGSSVILDGWRQQRTAAHGAKANPLPGYFIA